MANQLDKTEAWLYSVNKVNNLQKEEQQQKQRTTLQQIDIANIQDAEETILRVKKFIII